MSGFVDASQFYATDAGAGRGLGLFCRRDLHPGDAWWHYDPNDPRYIADLIDLDEFLRDPLNDEVKRLSYVDPEARQLVVCAEPFCRVNHSAMPNSDSLDEGVSVANQFIAAGTEITVNYDYDAVMSLVWKFEELQRLKLGEDVMLQRAADVPAVLKFLRSLS